MKKSSFSVFTRASLTVEAAFALPLFFMALVMLISFMNAVSFQVTENLKLSNEARTAAMYAAAAGRAAGGTAADGLYIDFFQIRDFAYPFSVIPVPKLKIALRARVYPWIGSDGKDTAAEPDSSPEQMVYLTDNESVYHTHSDCTHLDLTVIATTTEQIGKLRNAYGEKYKKCDSFPDNYRGTVYLTLKGDCYYPSLGYAGVTRHVRLGKLSDYRGLKECERCAARDQQEGAA